MYYVNFHGTFSKDWNACFPICWNKCIMWKIRTFSLTLFGNNVVKATVLLKKLLYSGFHEIFFGDREFLFFHTAIFLLNLFYVKCHVKNYQKLPSKLFSHKIRVKEKFSNFHTVKWAHSRFIFSETFHEIKSRPVISALWN